MDLHITLYSFYTTKKMTHVTVTITKNAIRWQRYPGPRYTTIINSHISRASERNYYWSGNFVKNVPPLKRIVPELQYCWKCSLLHNVFERQINQNRTKLKALHSLQHCNRIRLHCWNSSSCSWKLFNFRSESCELTGLKAYTSSTVFCL